MGKWDKYAVEDTVTAQGGSKWDKYAVEETVIEKPQAKEVKADQPKPTERDIPTVSMDAGGKLTPNDGGFDINNPTRPTGEIAIPKGGITSVALQIENDKIAKNQSEYVKKAKDEIRKLAINTDFSAPPQDPMMGQQQQSIEGGGVGPAVAAKATDYEKALNYIVNPENLPNNQIQLSPEDKAELAQYAQEAAKVAPAIQKYSKDVEVNPDDVDALNNLGDNLFHVGDTKNALSAYSKAASIKENGLSLMGLGNVYLKAGDNVNATKAFEDSFTKDGNPDALIKAAYSNSLEGDIDRSEKILNGVKSNFPDYSYGYALSAHNKEVIGDKSGAAADNAIYEVLRQQELLPESVNADDPNSDYAKERASQQARMQNVADAIAAPINFFGEMEMGTIHGGIEGLQKVGKGLQGVLIGGDKIGAILDILNGAAETVFSGGMAAAPMTNLTFHALPEPVTKVLMQPLSMINALSDSEVEKFSKNGQALTALGNTVVSILFLVAVHGKKPPFTAKEQEAILHIVKGEAITGEASSLKNIVEKAKKYLEESKLSDIQKSAEIYKSIPGELSIEGKIAVAPDLVKREKLSTEMEKASPAFKNYYAEKIKGVDEDINSKLSINLGLKEQAAEKTKTAEEPTKSITNEKQTEVRAKQEGQGVQGNERVQQKGENDGQKTGEEKISLPAHADKLKDVSSETPITDVPAGLSVEYNGEQGTIGRSETGETLFVSKDGKETIISGGGDASTLAEKGIIRTEGFYSDKRGDYYVKDGKVYEVKDGNLKPVYEGEKANVERKQAIIRKALNPKENAVKEVSVQESVPEQRPGGNESGKTAEASSGDSVLGAEKSQEKVADNPQSRSLKDFEGAVTLKEVGNSHDVVFTDKEGKETKIGKVHGIGEKTGVERDSWVAPQLEAIHYKEVIKAVERGENVPKSVVEHYLSSKIESDHDGKLAEAIKNVEDNGPTKDIFSEMEIEDAFRKREETLSQMARGKDYKTQFIHDNFGGISLADWKRFGDANWLKGKEGRAFKRKYIKEGDVNLEQVADALSVDAKVEITPQDIIDYIIDREANPKKYDGRLKKWDDAARIPEKDVSSILEGDDAMIVKVVEANRGFGMTDMEVDLIKKYVEDVAKKKRAEQRTAASVPENSRPTSKSSEVGRKKAESKKEKPVSEPVKKSASPKKTKAEENKYAKAEEKITKVFDLLRKKMIADLPEGTQKMGFGLEDLLNTAEQVIIKAIRAGEKIDIAIGKGIDHIKERWDKSFGEFPEKEIRDILLEDKQFSIKNENSQARVEEMGMSDAYHEVTKQAARSFEKVWDETEADIKKNPVAAESLRNELTKNPRPVTDKEDALLLRDQIDLENERERIVTAINEATSEQVKKDLSAKLNQVNNALFDNFVASKLVGTSTARGLNARKMLATRKYSLVNLQNELRADNKGKPLTPEQESIVEAKHKEIKEKAKKWDDFQKDQESYLKNSAIDNIKESIARERKIKPKSVLSDQEISRKKELSAKYRGIFNDVTNVAKSVFEKEFYEYAGLVLKEAAGDFAEFSKEMVRSVGKGISKRLPEIYKEVSGKDAPKEAYGVIRNEEGKLVVPKKLIRDLVESGIEDINDIVSEVRKIEPDASEREIRDAVSDYGKTINVSKDEIDVKIRQARQMGRLISALEDVENKQRPLKSGLQRDKLTDQARRLQKEIKELMKDLPEDAAETESKWRTSLDAQKRRVENQITDIEQKIENIKNGVPNKEEVKTVFKKDAELEYLIEQRDERRKVLQELEGKKEMSAEQRIQNAMNSVERAIKATQEKIDNNKLEREPVKKLSSPELDALREKLAAHKEELEQMRSDAGIIQRERNERYKKSAEERIKEYKKRKANRDFAPKKRTQTELDDQSVKLQADLAMAKAEWELERERVRLENLGASEKVVNGVIKYAREGLLTGIGTLFKLSSFAITRQAVIRPLYNIIGEMLRLLPPVRVLAKGAPIEGRFNAEALGENYKAMVSKNTREQALQKLKKGKSNNDLLYGKDLMRELPMLPTRSHGAIKQFAYQAEFSYAKKSLEKWAEKEGIDNNQALQKWIGEYAHAKGLDAIYMGEANLLKIYQLALRQGDIKGGSGKVFAKVAKLLFPITKVPYNFVKDVALHSPFSLAAHTAKLFRKSFTDTIKDMTPEQKDLLMLNLKKGALGTVMYAIGYFGHQSFGGNYSILLKRYNGDKDAGDLDLMGAHIPHFMTHNALAETAQLGATAAKMFDVMSEKGESFSEAMGWSILMSSLSEVEKAPFIGETARILTSMKQPKGVSDYTGQFVSSRLIPRLVQESAEFLDGEKRKPNTFIDQFKTKIPGLRQEVPLKAKPDRPDEKPVKKARRRKRSANSFR